MADNVMFDEPDDSVLEIVLSSDEEYQGDVGGLNAEERRARRQGLAARFLPGVDAGAMFALGMAVVGLTSSAMLDAYVTNRQLSSNFSTSTRVRSSADYDIFAPVRELTRAKAMGSGMFALAAVAIAVLVLSRWRQDTHTRWSRPAAQTALCLGLLGLVFAILLYSGVMSGLPSVHDSTSGDQFGS